MRRLAMFACVVMLISLGVAPSYADKRMALVIGNSNYQHAGRLVNPAGDAGAVAVLLRASGFEAVDQRTDVTFAEMRSAIADFTDIARDADIAIVYYSGYGIEVDGANYLIPIDATLARDSDVQYEAVSLDWVLRAIEPTRRLRLVILDASRDSPFVNTMRRTTAVRTIGRGLARVEPKTGELVAFAARPGSTASDGSGRNSPYTTALLQHLTTPGLDVRLAFGRVRDQVLASTGGTQEPFVYGSLGGAEVSLRNEPAAPSQVSEAAQQAWAVTQNTTSVAVLEDFIRQFGATPYGLMARVRLEELKRTASGITAIDRPTSSEPPSLQYNLPTFPSPPPAASAFYPLPRDLFASQSSVGEVVATIIKALERTGYVERSFFRTDAGGVALVTRLERINDDGSPRNDRERWPGLRQKYYSSLDLIGFLRGFFYVDPGRYRVIVFILQELPFSQSSNTISGDEARGWLRTGANVLPREVEVRPFSGGNCTALIYEFANDGTAVHLVVESSLTGKQHLEKAGVMAFLEKAN